MATHSQPSQPSSPPQDQPPSSFTFTATTTTTATSTAAARVGYPSGSTNLNTKATAPNNAAPSPSVVSSSATAAGSPARRRQSIEDVRFRTRTGTAAEQLNELTDLARIPRSKKVPRPSKLSVHSSLHDEYISLYWTVERHTPSPDSYYLIQMRTDRRGADWFTLGSMARTDHVKVQKECLSSSCRYRFRVVLCEHGTHGDFSRPSDWCRIEVPKSAFPSSADGAASTAAAQEWHLSTKSGRGTFVHPIWGTYTGECKRNRPHGRGTWEHPEGDRYEGQLRRGLRHGEGRYVWASGSSYSGSWALGQKSGYGKWQSANGESYVGTFSEDLPNGIGFYVWPTGHAYRGEFLHGIINGKGQFSWPDGKRFKGSFSNGEPVLQDGQVFSATGSPMLRTTMIGAASSASKATASHPSAAGSPARPSTTTTVGVASVGGVNRSVDVSSLRVGHRSHSRNHRRHPGPSDSARKPGKLDDSHDDDSSGSETDLKSMDLMTRSVGGVGRRVGRVPSGDSGARSAQVGALLDFFDAQSPGSSPGTGIRNGASGNSSGNEGGTNKSGHRNSVGRRIVPSPAQVVPFAERSMGSPASKEIGDDVRMITKLVGIGRMESASELEGPLAPHRSTRHPSRAELMLPESVNRALDRQSKSPTAWSGPGQQRYRSEGTANIFDDYDENASGRVEIPAPSNVHPQPHSHTHSTSGSGGLRPYITSSRDSFPIRTDHDDRISPPGNNEVLLNNGNSGSSSLFVSPTRNSSSSVASSNGAGSSSSSGSLLRSPSHPRSTGSPSNPSSPVGSPAPAHQNRNSQAGSKLVPTPTSMSQPQTPARFPSDGSVGGVGRAHSDCPSSPSSASTISIMDPNELSDADSETGEAEGALANRLSQWANGVTLDQASLVSPSKAKVSRSKILPVRSSRSRTALFSFHRNKSTEPVPSASIVFDK